MERKDMEQLRAMRQELETMKREYLVMPKVEEVADTYNDYKTGHKMTKVVRGFSSAKADELRDKIYFKVLKLEAKIIEMEEWIECIEDSNVRDIFRLYYAMGLTQEQIGQRKHYSNQRISQIIDEYWKIYL